MPINGSRTSVNESSSLVGAPSPGSVFYSWIISMQQQQQNVMETLDETMRENNK